MDNRWRTARTLQEMGDLIVLWLQGEIDETPWHPEPDDETQEIVDALIQINQLGFVTDNSQPGAAGPTWAQRATVSGHCAEGIASRLVDAGVWSDLIVLSLGPGVPGTVAVPVSRSDDGPGTIAGAARRDRNDESFGLSAGLADQIEDAWYVEVIDPVWGRNGVLWSTLIDHLSLGPFTARSPWMTAEDLGHG